MQIKMKRTLVFRVFSWKTRFRPFSAKGLLNHRVIASECTQYTGNSLVHYYRSETFEDESFSVQILVQDVGLRSLRALVTDTRLSRESKLRITHSLVTAVSEIHRREPSMVHRDIRPENVVLMRDGSIRLVDLGLAVTLRPGNTHTAVSSSITTSQLREVLQEYARTMRERSDDLEMSMARLPASTSGDIFMLGKTLAYLYGADPFENERHILDGRPATFTSEWRASNSPWLVHLLEKMLSHDKTERPTIEEVQEHPYIRCSLNMSAYFIGHLVGRIYRIAVNDRSPRNDGEFKAMLELLRPIEEHMRLAELEGRPWHRDLPADVLRLNRPTFQSSEAISFVDDPSTPYPLPLVGRFLLWIRNALVHLTRSELYMQMILNCRGADRPYEYVGDFFAHHPAVNWFLIKFWETWCIVNRNLRATIRSIQIRFQTELDELETRLEDYRAMISM